MLASPDGQWTRHSAVPARRASPVPATAARRGIARARPGVGDGLPARSVCARPAASPGAGVARAGRGRPDGLGPHLSGRPESGQLGRCRALDRRRAARHRRRHLPRRDGSGHGLPHARRPAQDAAGRDRGYPGHHAGGGAHPGRVPGHGGWQPAGAARAWRLTRVRSAGEPAGYYRQVPGVRRDYLYARPEMPGEQRAV
jgi:hypothetical protein